MTEQPTVAIVLSEDPNLHLAGHAGVARSYIAHLAEAGFRVVCLLPTDRLGFIRHPAGPIRYVSPGLRTIGGRPWLLGPAGVVRVAGWRLYTRLPRRLQRAISVGRDAARNMLGYRHVLGRPLTAAQNAFLVGQLRRLRADVILYNSPFLVPLQEPGAGIEVVIAHDVLHLRARSFARAGYRLYPPGLDHDAEVRLIGRISTLIAIHWDDAAVLRAMAPRAHVMTVPPIIPITPHPRWPHRRDLIFVGSGSLHNVDGLEWFVSEVWPRVRARLPSVSLNVYGTVCYRVAPAPGVVLHGVTRELEAAYARALLAVVPLRAGSGLKVKLAEAIVMGVAAVTTSVGAEGLTALTPPPFAVADDSEAMAASICRLATCAAARSALEQACALHRRRFQAGEAFREFDAWLAERGVVFPGARAPTTGVVDV